MSKYSAQLIKFLEECKMMLDASAITSNSSNLQETETCTFKTHQKVLALLKPENIEELKHCINCANKNKIPVYTISTGKNWGYGSKVPVIDESVVISLERMNKIIECNEELGYIVVEPGVTFQQVFDYLNEKDYNVYSPATGSSPYSSLIGNALERGIGKGVYYDRFLNACNMEVLLPNGEIINTGFGAMNNSSTKNLYKWGIGPSLDGLFTQSNFGVVTKMTFWLAPKLKQFHWCVFSVKSQEKLLKAIDKLRILQLEGTVRTNFLIINMHRMLSASGLYPWEEMKGKTPLSDKLLKQKAAQCLNASWIGELPILCATKEQANAHCKRIKALLKPWVDFFFIVNEQNIKLLKIFRTPIRWITNFDVGTVLHHYYHSPHVGVPIKNSILMGYWRKKKLPSLDPLQLNLDTDKCGLIWVAPAVPATAKDLELALNIIYKAFNDPEYKFFEPNIGMQGIGRTIVITIGIIYDREISNHDQIALKFSSYLKEKLSEAGYISYRSSISEMNQPLISDNKEYLKIIQQIKLVLDPNNILSPQRYNIVG